MSKTIRNEQTKGFLDKLQLQRKTRKMVRLPLISGFFNGRLYNIYTMEE